MVENEYWKRPEQQENHESVDPGIGIWSRSRPLRASVWVVSIVAAIILALVASAYLSGFSSPLAMFDWIREIPRPR
jgi:hypothetical protein